MKSDDTHFVFAFGSLASSRSNSAEPVELPGFVRTWGVAMDNSVDLPGYKYYVSTDGTEVHTRPNCCVAFLDIVEQPGGVVNGLLLPVDWGAIVQLDTRERNYRRIDASPLFPHAGVNVWAFAGCDDARERRDRASEQGCLVVQRDYLEGVEAAFKSLGDGQLERFRESTEPLDCPVVDLLRIDLD